MDGVKMGAARLGTWAASRNERKTNYTKIRLFFNGLAYRWAPLSIGAALRLGPDGTKRVCVSHGGGK
jgi:hypothetical protein